MKSVYTFLVLCYLFFCNSFIVEAQKRNNLSNENEIALIDILSADTINSTTISIESKDFPFGQKKSEFNNFNIIKDKKRILIQPLGTGKLFSVKKIDGQYEMERIDSTVHSGSSFYSYNYMLRDTLFQTGGQGFWHIRGITTYFSKETHQWELCQSNRLVYTYFDYIRHTIPHINLKSNNPKLYVTNSFRYDNFPNSFTILNVDSLYVFDLNTRSWSTLGMINPSTLQKINSRNSNVFHFGDFVVFQSELEFYWLNFSKNTLGKLSNQKNGEFREIWLSMYGIENIPNFSPLQFNLGNDIYFVSINKDRKLIYKKATITLSDFDNSNLKPIYLNNSEFLNINWFKSNSNISILIIILLSCIVIYFSFKYVINKKKLPKEVTSILNDNFFNSLSIIEKELLDVLYHHYLKGESLSTKLINKIIGVQQKDVLTQNKSRSDYFIRINQKYKMSTQKSEPLIIKNRDKIDKRQYNYSINKEYIPVIEKMLKD